MHRLIRSLTILAATTLLASGSVVAETKIVTIKGMKFEPAELTVRSGDTVIWRNDDLFAHNVHAEQNDFKSPVINPKASWTFTASKNGKFVYTCTLHPSMRGVVIVKEGSGGR